MNLVKFQAVKRQAAFTMVEVALSMGVLAIAMVAILGLEETFGKDLDFVER